MGRKGIIESRLVVVLIVVCVVSRVYAACPPPDIGDVDISFLESVCSDPSIPDGTVCTARCDIVDKYPTISTITCEETTWGALEPNCTTCTACDIDEVVLSSCNGTHDRQCFACSDYYRHDPVDNVCGPCINGYWNVDLYGNSLCTEVHPCGLDQYITSNPTNISDYGCSNCTICADEQYYIDRCDGSGYTSSSLCGDCDESCGTCDTSDAENCTSCSPGYYVIGQSDIYFNCSNACNVSHEHCSTCEGPSTTSRCTSCKDFSYLSDGACVYTCPASLSASGCLACAGNDSSSPCLSCKSGYKVDGVRCFKSEQKNALDELTESLQDTLDVDTQQGRVNIALSLVIAIVFLTCCCKFCCRKKKQNKDYAQLGLELFGIVDDEPTKKKKVKKNRAKHKNETLYASGYTGDKFDMGQLFEESTPETRTTIGIADVDDDSVLV